MENHNKENKETVGDVSVYAQTDVGMVRTNNEDSFLVCDTTSADMPVFDAVRSCNTNEQSAVMMVADGMGGPAAGEVASLLGVTTVKKTIQNNTPSKETEFTALLINSLEKANTAINEKAKSSSEMKGMGTTATLAGLYNGKLILGQVGDSRAYIVRDNTIKQVTKDQSYVSQLIEKGIISEEESETHPKKNIILQALGTQPSIQVAITTVDIRLNDYLLLCSDGLSGMLSKDEMKKIITSSPDIKAACNELISSANKKGGQDNITVVMAHFSGTDTFQPAGSEKINFKVLSEYTP